MSNSLKAERKARRQYPNENGTNAAISMLSAMVSGYQFDKEDMMDTIEKLRCERSIRRSVSDSLDEAVMVKGNTIYDEI